jgi:hypothetical protein
MKCPACDASAPKGARFCPQCGVSIAETAAEKPIPGATSDADLHAARAFADDVAQRHVAAPRDSLGASMAKGAAVGALVSLPVPFIGPLAGAFVGAGVAAYKSLTED